MRGYVEESLTVKLRRALLESARHYGGMYLSVPFGERTEEAERVFVDTAIRYVDALREEQRPAKRQRRTTHPPQKGRSSP